MKILSSTGDKTKLEESLRPKFMSQFDDRCENNFIHFNGVKLNNSNHMTVEEVTIQIFYNSKSECDCFSDGSFQRYAGRFLNIGSAISGDTKVINSSKHPLVNNPYNVPNNIDMKRVISVRGRYSS